MQSTRLRLRINAVMTTLAMDGAVNYSLLSTVISAVGLLASTVAVGHFLSLSEQGYFYTFASLLAMQSLFELGFGQCIIQFCSHEVASLEFSAERRIYVGDPRAQSRLADLYRLAAKWYRGVAAFVLLGVGAAGICFFSRQELGHEQWLGPWVLACGATAAYVLLLPELNVLEGCNQVTWVAKVRFWGNAAKYATLLACVSAGCGLYAVGLATVACVALTALCAKLDWTELFSEFKSAAAAVNPSQISWKSEIWPFQWRIAVSWFCGFFIFSLFNPLLMHFQDAESAGRFGMSWSLLQGVSALASAWTRNRSPQYGIWIAQRQWSTLDGIWWRTTVISTTMSFGAAAVLIIATILAESLSPPIAARVLPLGPFIALSAAVVLNQVGFSQASLLRAHKSDPFMPSSILGAVLIGSCAVMLTRNHGMSGAALAYLIPTVLITPLNCWIFIAARARLRALPQRWCE